MYMGGDIMLWLFGENRKENASYFFGFRVKDSGCWVKGLGFRD